MKKTIAGLAMLAVSTPFQDYFGSILDLAGEWTQEMIDAHADEDEQIGQARRRGLEVWEGECEVETHDAGTEYECRTFEFRGAWRRLTTGEGIRLIAGFMPLSDREFPSSNEDRIKIPPT